MITIDGFVIDAALSEQHDLNNEVTSEPIEGGGQISDHSMELPDEIELVCVISDHPLPAVALKRGLLSPGTVPSLAGYERLKQIRKNKKAVTITSSLGTHANMMITSLGIPRQVSDGASLRFKVKFKKLEIVTNERTIVRIAVPQQAKRVDRGNKPAKSPPDTPAAKKTERNASILHKLFH